jgi:hypothetical protein
MSDKVIIWSQSSGSIAVCIPTGEISIEEVLAKDCPTGSIIVDKNILPRDDDFFDAFVLNNDNTVTVDLEKAKKMTRDRLRRERISLLEQQDILYMRTLESGLPTTSIVSEKQRLRDLPTLADACTTLDELRSLKA